MVDGRRKGLTVESRQTERRQGHDTRGVQTSEGHHHVTPLSRVMRRHEPHLTGLLKKFALSFFPIASTCISRRAPYLNVRVSVSPLSPLKTGNPFSSALF